jgi:hypothetical protein
MLLEDILKINSEIIRRSDLDLKLPSIFQNIWKILVTSSLYTARNTIPLVASAPQYPHGVLDPVQDCTNAFRGHFKNKFW